MPELRADDFAEMRAQSKRWKIISNPVLWVSILSLVGAAIGIWVLNDRRVTTQEVITKKNEESATAQYRHLEEVINRADQHYAEVAKNLDERSAKFEGAVVRIETTVGQMSNVITELRTDYNALLRDNVDLKRSKDEFIKSKADLEHAQKEIEEQKAAATLQNTYISNLRGRLDQLEAIAKLKKGD